MIGNTYEQVVQWLGKPRIERTSGTTRVVMYNSSSMTLADVYYFEDNKLVVESLSFYKQPKPMDLYIFELGKPEHSIRKYAAGTPDSLITIVHVWPDKGRAITTTGTAQNNVIRDDQFAPMSTEEYFSSLGSQIAQHERVPFVESQTATATPIPRESVAYSKRGVFFDVVIVLLIVGVSVFLRRRRTKQSQQTP